MNSLITRSHTPKPRDIKKKVRKMKGSWKVGAFIKHKCIILLKLLIMLFATALSIHVLLYRSTADITLPPTSSHSPVQPIFFTPSHQYLPPPTVTVPVTVSMSDSFSNFTESNAINDTSHHQEVCDPFTGYWIPNPSGPVYTNETCDLIESHQNCMKNGRPDMGYLYWRWRPKNCELPPFDAQRFLQLMRNKTWALIGDSISRNHVQSLVCILSKVEEAVFFYHDEDYKSKGWRFPSYNLTIYVMWSPFLVEAAIFEDINGVSTREIELHLDRLDNKWTELYQNLDYMIFSTGKWFVKSAIYYENDTIVGCHYCPKRNFTELGFDFAYRKALRSTFNFIATSSHRGLIFFRTSTPDHFEGGEWHNGGKCNRTVPFKEGEVEIKELHTYLRRVELEEFEVAAAKAAENEVRLKLLDFMQLSLLRPDGHPGPYRQFYPFAKDKNAVVQNDCLHWCLPGPIDSWNDVIMQMVVNG